MTTHDQLIAAIERDEIVDLLRRLVAIDTVNPPGGTEAAVALCATTLESAGFACRTVVFEPGKSNLIAELGSDGGPALCFNAHLDVVPVGDPSAWRYPPFGGVIEGGRMYGRGVLDDKASVVAQLAAGRALARTGRLLHGKLIVTLVADEEIGGMAGSAPIVRGGHIAPDFAIVGEPTSNRVCVGERGGGLVRVQTTGRTAHGALPWEGANAIDAMAMVVSALRSELGPKLEMRTHPLFQRSSMSVNRIDGGVQDNVVPDICTLSIDRRYIPEEDPVVGLAEIREIAERAIADAPGTAVSMWYDGEYSWARMSPVESPLVQAMLAANRALGLDSEPAGFDMATDGRFFAAAGVPTIIYGPGDPRVTHIPDEWVAIDDVVSAARAYAIAAWTLIGSR